jgi:aldose 1-epimerase
VRHIADRQYRHCLIGRYANRLPAERALKLPSGDSITLPSHPSKGQNLHGGPTPFGWDEKVLDKVELEKATLFSPKEIQYLKGQSAGIWSLTSPDGEGGHLGTVYCEIALAVLDSTASGELGQVVLVYRAKLLDKPSTALNLTHHWGFNLAASHIAKGQRTPARDISIENHVLTVNSKEILEHDPETGLVTGTTLSLSKPSAELKDFRGGKTIGKIGDGYPKATRELGQGFLGDGYDDFWVFEREPMASTIKESELDQRDVFGEINAE